jgi:tRNA 2-thiocytidine biosynthesis protein TtcA
VRLTKQEGRKRVDDGLVLLKRATERYGFLKKHTRVIVGVSGGVDSTVLLTLLHEYNKRYKQHWHLIACHIDINTTPQSLAPLEKLIAQNGIEIIKVKTRFKKNLQTEKISRCYTCSRLRRQRLLETAESLNIFQIALAHHKQDVAETILLNMLYNGEISTLVPKQPVIQGRHFFIRPLYYFDKEHIKTIASIYRLPVSTKPCPYFKNSKREFVRKFLEQCRVKNPDVYKNIFRGIFHVKRTYLP